MKSSRNSIILVIYGGLISLFAIALITYKVVKLGFPIIPGKEVSEWTVEAKISFKAKGKEVSVKLALPNHVKQDLLSNNAASVGYGYQQFTESNNWLAIWSARNRKGAQQLYYRIRLPESATQHSSFTHKGDTRPVVAVKPSYTGITAQACRQLVQTCQEQSADPQSFAIELISKISDESPSQEIQLIRNHYQKYPEDLWLQPASIDLLRMANIPARRAYGVRLDEDHPRQDPFPLIEYFDKDKWRIINPFQVNKDLSSHIMVWKRGGDPLLIVEGGENSKITFSTEKISLPAEIHSNLEKGSFFIPTLTSLPLSERTIFQYILLIPLGVLVVVLCRNIIGISTLGTFMPVLLALSFLEIPFFTALSFFLLMLLTGLFFRFHLSKLNLLVVPRVAATVVIVTILMILVSILSYRFDLSSGIKITAFPMIILAWTIERMSLLWEEEGGKSALKQIAGSIIVAILAFALMKVEFIRHLLFYFPETLLIIFVFIIIIGRYMGYRVNELWRFKVQND